MKLSFFLLIILIIFTEIISIDNNETFQNETKKKKKKKKKKNKDDSDSKYIPETSGVHINETVFDAKLQKIIEEKNLKPDKKITKANLQTIFTLIYRKEENPEDAERIKKRFPSQGEPELTPKEQSDKFMETLFNKVARGLDYDDKIKVKDIKYWIAPNRTQEAYDEILYQWAEEVGYL